MKKLATLILALCIILSAFALTACGDTTPADGTTPSGEQSGSNTDNKTDNKTDSNTENKTDNADNKTEASAYETVSAAIEKTLKAKSYEANLDTLRKNDLLGYKSEDTVKCTIKATAADTDQVKASSVGKITTQGQEMDQNYYYEGGWKYFGSEEMGRYKSQVTFEDFAKEIGAPQTVIKTLPEAIFGSAQSQKNDDGSLTVTIPVDETNIETIYKDAITEIVYDVVGNDLNQSLTKDASIVVTVADGYVREYKVAFVCEITAGNDRVAYDITNTLTFVSVDKDVTVAAPGNLNDYNELDWG